MTNKSAHALACPMRGPAPPAMNVRSSALAGATAGQLGAVGFWIFHTIWIADVPVVLLEGALWGAAAGAATGWAYEHLRARGRFPERARGGLLLGAMLWLLLVPFELVGLAFGPFTHLTRPAELAALAPVGLLGAPLGALAGWALTHDRRASVALGVATLLLHFMMGGSLVYFGGRGLLLALFLLLLPTYLVAGLLFARLRGRLLARAVGRDGPSEVIS